MTIRNRLLILLLSMALTPLILVSVVYQISIRIARHRLAANTKQALDVDARLALQEQLRSHVQILKRDRQLVVALLERQAREVALALSGGQLAENLSFTENTFGYDANVPTSPELYHSYFRDTNDPNVAALQVDYQRQGYSIAPRGVRTEATKAMKCLSRMTSFYHEIYGQMPAGTLWLHTRLENGLHTRYPAGGTPPDVLPQGPRMPGRGLDGRMANDLRAGRPPDVLPQGPRMPARRPDGGPADQVRGGRPAGVLPQGSRMPARRPDGRLADEVRGGGLVVDPSTKQIVVVRSMPVANPDGSLLGTVAMMRTIPEIFEDMELPERWGLDTERMMVLADPNVGPEQGVRILLHEDLAKRVQRWRRRVIPGRLHSGDPELLGAMIDDILAGSPGVRRMDYKGRSCLWAYQPIEITRVAALLIVPYERVTELAQTMERSLVRESVFWLQTTTAVLLVVVASAVVLAAMRARSLTNPISALMEAGRRLAGGDYDAKVHIATGDELEQLGLTFNQTGPKLRERERMKHSLELAGAVQQCLLPREVPDLTSFEVAGRCVYCDETGGDCYDFIELSEPASGKLGIAVGDVSGHGIGSALLMAAVRSMLRTEAHHRRENLAQLLDKLNSELVRDTDDDKFVTLFYGVLDDTARSLIWASAGHEPAIWYHADNGRIDELPNTGVPLGIHEGAVFQQGGPVILEPGDILLVGTDGIWEAQDPGGQFFGKERFLDIICSSAGLSADQICTTVIDRVAQFVHPASRTDDITLIVIKFK